MQQIVYDGFEHRIRMKAALLRIPALIEKNPLVLADVPTPQPAENEVIV